MEVSEVKRMSDCEEMAIMDAYCEEEQAAGWYESLREALAEIDDIEILGDIGRYAGLELQGNQVLMKVKRNRKLAKVSLDSVTFLDAPRYVSTWIKAYKKYWM